MWKQTIKDSLLLRNDTQALPFIKAIESRKLYTDQELCVNTEMLHYQNTVKPDINPVTIEEKIYKVQEALSAEYESKAINTEKIIILKDSCSQVKSELDSYLQTLSQLQHVYSDLKMHQEEISDFHKILHISSEALQSESVQLTKKLDDLLLENEKLSKENNILIKSMISIKEDSMKRQDEILEIMKQLKQRETTLDDDYELIEDDSSQPLQYQPRIIPIKPPHKPLLSFKAHEVEGISLSFNSNGSTLLTSGNEKLLKTWDYLSGIERQSFSGFQHALLSFTIPESNDLVLAGSSSGEAYIWNSFNMRLKHKLNGHVGKINGTGFIKFGREAVTGSEDRTLKFWDVTRGYCTKSVQVSSMVYTLCVNKEDSSIITGHKDGNLLVLYPNTSRTTKIASENSAVAGCCFSSCGNYLACELRNHKIVVRDVRMMEVLAKLSHKSFLCPGTKAGISFSADSRMVSSGSFNGKILTWRLDGNCESVLNAGDKPVLAVEWHPMESQLASLDYSGNLTVWV